MMRDQLLRYYEGELAFIRRLAASFAEKYPELAEFLLLEPNRSQDPHVERLIEAFAMLTARVHLRLDEEFPEVTDALLGILYPHYLAPIPSLSIVEMSLGAGQGQEPGGVAVDRGVLLRSAPVDDVRCHFRTAYPVRLWPIRIETAEIVSTSELTRELPVEAGSALRLRLRTREGTPIRACAIDELTLFLNAESGALHVLYELFCKDGLGILLQDGERRASAFLPAERIQPLGFAPDEGLLDYPQESFLGYRLLQEYFAFPEKFLFVRLSGLDALRTDSESDTLEVSVLLPQPVAQHQIRPGASDFRLGCTPVVNLFPHPADPIRLEHTTVEYRVNPDSRSPRSFEVQAITSVSGTALGEGTSRPFHPFYALRHGMTQAADVSFWHATRRPALRKNDDGTDVFLTLVDREFNPLAPADTILSVETLCSNRDLPSRLPFGDPSGDLQVEGRPEISTISCLRKPTPPLRPPLGAASRWRLISHLSLNYLSLSEGSGGTRREPGASKPPLDALREILKLYDFADSAVTRQRIDGLVDLRSRPVVRRVRSNGTSAFARGVEVTLEFDEERYTGGGVFLFASVLERFLGLYTSINAFTQTVARVRQREGDLKRWPPRAGERQLL